MACGLGRACVGGSTARPRLFTRALHGSHPAVLFTAGVPHHVRIANLMVTLPAGVGSRAALARVPPPQALNHHHSCTAIYQKLCACNAACCLS